MDSLNLTSQSYASTLTLILGLLQKLGMLAGVAVPQKGLLGKMDIPVSANMNLMISLIREVTVKDPLSVLVQLQRK